MIKKIYLFIYTLIIISTYIQTTSAANFNGWGDAATLKVTMRKLELCTGFEDTNANVDASDLTAEMINSKIATDTFCNNPVVIGSGDQEIDIASVEAGFAAASYGQPTLLPLGETFTHMRVTIDRKFTIKNKLDKFGKGLNTGGSVDTSSCNTQKTTDAMYGNALTQFDNHVNWTESKEKYTTRTAIDETEDGTPEEMNVYYVNGRMAGDEQVSTMDHCYGNECSEWDINWSWGYTQSGAMTGSGKNNAALAMSVPTSAETPGIGTNDIILIYALENPYTISTTPPLIDISFGTESGVLVYEASKSEGSGWRNGGTPASNNDGKCAFAVGFVNVKITMKDTEIRRRRSRGAWN